MIHYLYLISTYLNLVLIEIGDIKATLAAINFIINNAAKFDVEEQTLANELGQLGMPKGMSLSFILFNIFFSCVCSFCLNSYLCWCAFVFFVFVFIIVARKLLCPC